MKNPTTIATLNTRHFTHILCRRVLFQRSALRAESPNGKPLKEYAFAAGSYRHNKRLQGLNTKGRCRFTAKSVLMCLLILLAVGRSRVAHADFSFTRYATVSPAAGWSFVGGEFTGDSLTDLAAYHPSDGSVYVGRNTGSSFKFIQYATVSPAAGWSLVRGEFTGDNLADLVAYHPSDGSVYVGRNMGSSFKFIRYATVSPAAGWSFVGGEFTGDNLADLVAYHPSDGSVYVGRNTGSNFKFIRYATVSPAAGWSFVGGKFTGHSLTDLAAYHSSDGTVWVGRNTGSIFQFTRYATVSPAAGWSIVGGEFTGDSLADLVAYHPSDGSVYVGRNTGSIFQFTRYATVSPAAGWSFVGGEFTGDSLTDLAAYHPSDGSVYVGRNTGVQKPDLVPERIPGTVDDLGFCRIEDDNLVVRVRNQGNSDVLVQTTTVVQFSPGGPRTSATPPIPHGSFADVMFPIGRCFEPDCDFTITLDADQVVKEVDERNNTVSASCIG
jgi:hypothetical protein